MSGSQYKVKESCCPTCGKLLDGASHLDKNVIPKRGNLTICIYCLAPSQFGEEMDLSPIDTKILPKEVQDELLFIQRLISKMRIEKNHGAIN